MLGPFHIRQLKVAEPGDSSGAVNGGSRVERTDGAVKITAPAYDKLITDCPDASLMYMDDDDGDIVGSALELRQRLNEPVERPMMKNRRSRTSLQPSSSRPADPRLSPVSASMHCFDIKDSGEAVSLWRHVGHGSHESPIVSSLTSGDKTGQSPMQNGFPAFCGTDMAEQSRVEAQQNAFTHFNLYGQQPVDRTGEIDWYSCAAFRDFEPTPSSRPRNWKDLSTGTAAQGVRLASATPPLSIFHSNSPMSEELKQGLTTEGKRQAVEAGARLRSSLQPKFLQPSEISDATEAHAKRWASYGAGPHGADSGFNSASLFGAFQEQMQKVSDITALNDDADKQSSQVTEAEESANTVTKQDTVGSSALQSADRHFGAPPFNSIVEGFSSLATDLREGLPEAQKAWTMGMQEVSQRLESAARDITQPLDRHVQQLIRSAEENAFADNGALGRYQEAVDSICRGLQDITFGVTQIGSEIFAARAPSSAQTPVPGPMPANVQGPSSATAQSERQQSEIEGPSIQNRDTREVSNESSLKLDSATKLYKRNHDNRHMDTGLYAYAQAYPAARAQPIITGNGSLQSRFPAATRLRGLQPERHHLQQLYRTTRTRSPTAFPNTAELLSGPQSLRQRKLSARKLANNSREDTSNPYKDSRCYVSSHRSPVRHDSRPHASRSRSPRGRHSAYARPATYRETLKSRHASPFQYLDVPFTGLDSNPWSPSDLMFGSPTSPVDCLDSYFDRLANGDLDDLKTSIPSAATTRVYEPFRAAYKVQSNVLREPYFRSNAGNDDSVSSVALPQVPPKISDENPVKDSSDRGTDEHSPFFPGESGNAESIAKGFSRFSEFERAKLQAGDGAASVWGPYLFARPDTSGNIATDKLDMNTGSKPHDVQDLYASPSLLSMADDCDDGTLDQDIQFHSLRRAKTVGSPHKPAQVPHRSLSSRQPLHSTAALDELHDDKFAIPSASVRFPSLSQFESRAHQAKPMTVSQRPPQLPTLPIFPPLAPQKRERDSTVPILENKPDSSNSLRDVSANLYSEGIEAPRLPGAWPVQIPTPDILNTTEKENNQARRRTEIPDLMANRSSLRQENPWGKRVQKRAALRSSLSQTNEAQRQEDVKGQARLPKLIDVDDDDVEGTANGGGNADEFKRSDRAVEIDNNIWRRDAEIGEPSSTATRSQESQQEPQRSVQFADQEHGAVAGDGRENAAHVTSTVSTPLNRKMTDCVDQLRYMGFGQDVQGNVDMKLLRACARMSNGDLEAALEMIEEDRQAHDARRN